MLICYNTQTEFVKALDHITQEPIKFISRMQMQNKRII